MRITAKNGFVIILIGILSVHALGVKNYDIVLPSYPPNGVVYESGGINDLNQIVGPNWNSGHQRAYLWAAGVFNHLPIPNGDIEGNYANDINNTGHYTGAESIERAGVLWNGTQLISLGTLGGYNSIPYALNESDQVVGSSRTSVVNRTDPFLWQNNSIISLGTLGGTYGIAYDINNQGVIVGISTNADDDIRAFIYEDGAMTDLGTLGGDQSAALAVNDANEIVGYSEIENGYQHACYWKDGRITDLGTLGGNQSQAYSINNAGLIFGWAETETGYRPLVVWENKQPIRLNSLIDPGSGWELTGRSDNFGLKPFFKINNQGVLMGKGCVNGSTYTFLMIPRQDPFLKHDSNGDGTVNMMDYMQFSNEWLQ